MSDRKYSNRWILFIFWLFSLTDIVVLFGFLFVLRVFRGSIRLRHILHTSNSKMIIIIIIMMR